MGGKGSNPQQILVATVASLVGMERPIPASGGAFSQALLWLPPERVFSPALPYMLRSASKLSYCNWSRSACRALWNLCGRSYEVVVPRRSTRVSLEVSSPTYAVKGEGESIEAEQATRRDRWMLDVKAARADR